ncbi:fungal-specific transcription factor domain-containing protein [Mycena amicta]|nr:fungal-specific transcription factor domain-containing protein [Mycena amicta]
MSEPSKKRSRNAGACDLCKRRKIRCDSGQAPGNRCSNCVNAGAQCTHAEIMKTLGSAKGYVESLETRLEKMERLLNKLLPGIDFTEQLEQDDDGNSPDATDNIPRNDADHLLEGAIKKLTLNPEEHRFFGKSSGVQFVQTALNFKSHYTGPSNLAHSSLPKKRNEYWESVKWLLPAPADEDHPQYTFPEPDLLPVLVDLYFTNVNCYYPVLHRPTFERKLKDQLHLRDHRYAGTLLMVCSLGARHCNDPRVCLEGADNLHAAGWKWHNQVSLPELFTPSFLTVQLQVRVIPRHLIYKPNLYELQTITLSSIFLIAISPVAWNQIGFGLRRAQDVGAHRRMKQSHPTAEHEQWKRVFWVLLCLDWIAGTATGRPLAMHDQDYDQDFPVECDDEYWDLPEPLSFRQPKDKPAKISYFICYAKLLEIQASVTTTIYSPRQPRDVSGRPVVPVSDAQHIIAFDSALNSTLRVSHYQGLGSLLTLIHSVRWDPERKDPLFFNQSALLHAEYYHVQIMVHRPYIPAPLEVSRPGALPSLTICTNAARACARIFNAQDKLGIEAPHSMLAAAFTAAIVLLLHTWSGKRSGFAYNPSKEMNDVYICMKTLSVAEKRYQAAGRFNDIIVRLISVGDMTNEPFTKHYVEVTAPPFAQQQYEPPKGYEPSVFVSRESQGQGQKDPAASKWSRALSQQSMGDFNDSIDRPDLAQRSKVHSSVTPDIFTNPDFLAAYNGNAASDLEQFLRMEPTQLPGEMFVDSDSDVLSMWSAAPSGFKLDDWMQFMSSGIPAEPGSYSSAPTQYAPSPGPSQLYPSVHFDNSSAQCSQSHQPFLCRFKMWKSSSSAPASRPMPKTEASFTESSAGISREDKLRGLTGLVSGQGSLSQDARFRGTTCSSHRWDRFLWLYSPDIDWLDGQCQSTRSRRRRGEDCRDLSVSCIAQECAWENRTDNRFQFPWTADIRHARKLLRILMKSYAIPRFNNNLRLRPWFLLATVLIMLLLAFLGFTDFSRSLPVNDKALHFSCFGIATAVFYFIFDVEEESRRHWFWRNLALIFTVFVCFFCGGILSEFVQSMLPYKEFQFGDVVANLLGSSVGLFSSYYLERYYRTRREIARLYQPLDATSLSDFDEDEELQLLPTHRPQAPSKGAPKSARIGDVWDEREELFGIGGDSDDEDNRTISAGPLPSNPHRTTVPKVYVTPA